MTTLDIVERLDQIIALRPGDPFPEGWDSNNWAGPMSELLKDAKTEIEKLRLAKLPAWAQAALTSSSADITIVGNTPTAGAAFG